MMHTALRLPVLALLALLPFLTQAQGPNRFGQPDVPPGTPPAAVKPLLEMKGVVSWKTLSQVELIKQKDRYVPQFSDSVSALDKKEVKVQGFMMPLSAGERQSHFILASSPQTCMFCLPGGPEQFVEVKTKKPVKFTFEPIVVSGRMAVLSSDPTGVFYRLTDAVAQ